MPTSVKTPTHETEMSLLGIIHYSSYLNAAKDAVAAQKGSTVFVPSNGLYVSLAPETSAKTLYF
jgi:hypothetical protein